MAKNVVRDIGRTTYRSILMADEKKRFAAKRKLFYIDLGLCCIKTPVNKRKSKQESR